VKAGVWLYAKGMLMGAADIVPGVSGGTIAFITGIYEQLIASIKSVVPELWRFFGHRSVSRFWIAINGRFLLTLLAGILSSVILFAKLITYLLATYPIPVWAFFFGLIVASVFIVAKDVSRWGVQTVGCLIIGALLAWVLTSLAPAQLPQTVGSAFLSGYIAICAMILPGISGSFVLVILGTYTFILGSIKGFDLSVLSVFALGGVAGLKRITNILSWAFLRFRNATLSLLCGFMIGALNKVWPWKEVLSYRLNSSGQKVPLVESNVSPMAYEAITASPSFLAIAVGCGLSACILVVLIHHIAISTDTQATK